MNRHHGMLAAAVLALGSTGARAAEAPEVDLEFLEFLGSLDAEEEDWREYLVERPISTEKSQPPARADGKPETRSAEKPAPKQDKVKKP